MTESIQSLPDDSLDTLHPDTPDQQVWPIIMIMFKYKNINHFFVHMVKFAYLLFKLYFLSIDLGSRIGEDSVALQPCDSFT